MTATEHAAADAATGVKNDLKSLQTTTTQTLNVLRAILGLNLDLQKIESSNPQRPTVTKRLNARTPAINRGPKPAPSKRAPKFDIHETVEVVYPVLNDKARKQLATSTLNASLKLLSSDKVKEQGTKIQGAEASTSKQTRLGYPLKESSLNRQPKPGRKNVPEKVSLELTPTIECAYTAVECLRQLEDNVARGTQHQAVENGAVVLLEKAITLGLVEQAEFQLRRLHEQYWKRRKADHHSCGHGSTACAISSFLLVDTEQSKPGFRLATSIQSQCLRFILLKGASCFNATLLDALQLETEGSPCSTLLKGRDEGFLDDEPCAKQLQTISLAMSRLHALAKANTKSQSFEDDIVLGFSCLALQAKCLSLGVKQNSPNISKEVWTEFLELVKSRVTSKEADAKSLKETRKWMEALQASLISVNCDDRIPDDVYSIFTGFRSIADAFVQPLGQQEQAGPTKNGGTDAILVTCFKKIAATLSAPVAESDSFVQIIESEIQVLDRHPETIPKSFVLIAASCAKARKAVIGTVRNFQSSVQDEGLAAVHVEVQTAATRFIFATIHLWLRFTRQLTSSTKEQRGSFQSGQSTEHLVLSSAKNIESVLTIAEIVLHQNEPISKQAVVVALMNCLQLRLALEQVATFDNSSEEISKFFRALPGRISQIFWGFHRRSISLHQPQSESLHLLRLSIDTIGNRPLEERKAASQNVRLDKLARLLWSNNHPMEALKTIDLTIAAHIEFGLLADATDKSLTSTTDQTWNDAKDPVFALGQTLSLRLDILLHSDTKGPDEISCYSDSSLPSIQRAVLLERQYTLLLDKASTRLSSNFVRELVNTIAQAASEHFNVVWKIRFISKAIHLLNRCKTITARDVFSTKLIEDLLSCQQPLSDAVFLKECYPLLNWIVRVQLNFATGQMNRESCIELSSELKQLILEPEATALCPLLCDVQICLNQVTALSDHLCCYAAREHQLQTLRCLRQIRLLIQPPDEIREASLLLRIAALENQLGDTNAAGRTLVRADNLLENISESSHIQLERYLEHAEHLFNICDLDGSENALKLAGQYFNGTEHTEDHTSRPHFDTQSSLCRAAHIASRLAYHRGFLSSSFVFARKAVKLSTAIWTAIEKSLALTRSASADSTVHTVTAELSKLNLQEHDQGKRIRTVASCQPLIGLHERCLAHLGYLSMHSGLYQDALFYYQQASKVQRSAPASSKSTSADLALLYAHAGQTDLAEPSLKAAALLLPSSVSSIEECDEILKIAEAATRCNDSGLTQRCLEMLSAGMLPSTCDHRPPASHQAAKAKKPSTKLPKTSKTTSARQNKQSPIETQNSSAAHASPGQSIVLKELQSRLIQLENEFLISECIEDVDLKKALRRGLEASGAQLSLSCARLVLCKAIWLLSQDGFTNALAETALALPVKQRPIRKSGRMSFITERPETITRSETPTRMVSAFVETDDFQATGYELLEYSYGLLRSIGRDSSLQLPSAKINLMYKALTHVRLLSSTLPKSLSISCMQTALQCLVPNDVAESRERQTIVAEEATATKTQVQRWPALQSSSEEDDIETSQSQYSDLVKVLPNAWSVVSIAVSHDQHELLISKILAGSTPFLMRVPLSRPDLEGDDTNHFTLYTAQEELLDIIVKANASCHDERGSGDKQTRKEWYSEREKLDRRLETLLQNMESLWLGGFRGLLAGKHADDKLVSRFGTIFDHVLDKHLPSRQKSSKAKITKIELHAHVLELFTSLVFEESTEYEDSLTDLLYFVVDILQFNGEQNAYDEIDFDAMLVDVLDALRGYHATAPASQPGHIILILDKELAGFPWESLPCLQGLSVSRMPSLCAIQDRLAHIRAQSETADHYSISANTGAYMLNPSSDLTSTQATFSTIFTKQLSTYSTIINRVPTEAEFQSCLTDQPLFLYFGHGSGAQYIRGRTIRKLDKCAVTWLMGCSSAKMTECGDFESYGMPNYYMLGHSMAVVGTLWDVTDREIDRFALRGMCEWGLLEEDASMEGVWKKRKGKDVKREKMAVEERRGKVALDEAVSRARDECMLRYLSGASVVVYGLPVMLEKDM